jgi:hypothetical protein
MEARCLLCHDEGTDEEELIKLHENIDHHGHPSCLNTYYGCFQSHGCPLCGKDLDGDALTLVDLNIGLDKASFLDRLDLFEKRLAKLALKNYRKQSCPPELLKWVMPKLVDDYISFMEYYWELRAGIIVTISKNQSMSLQLLLNHLSKANIKIDLLSYYRNALKSDDKTCAKIILETVLKNQAAYAGNRLFEFLRAAIGWREMESASLILQKGIGSKFRKDVISNLCQLLRFVKPDINKQLYAWIGEWSPEELDYGLYLAAKDGDLKCCKFLISKGACIRRACVSGILLKQCLDQDNQDLLQYFDPSKVESSKARKGKLMERVKFQVDVKLLSLRLKLCAYVLKLNNKIFYRFRP